MPLGIVCCCLLLMLFVSCRGRCLLLMIASVVARCCLIVACLLFAVCCLLFVVFVCLWLLMHCVADCMLSFVVRWAVCVDACACWWLL